MCVMISSNLVKQTKNNIDQPNNFYSILYVGINSKTFHLTAGALLQFRVTVCVVSIDVNVYNDMLGKNNIKIFACLNSIQCTRVC